MDKLLKILEWMGMQVKHTLDKQAETLKNVSVTFQGRTAAFIINKDAITTSDGAWREAVEIMKRMYESVLEGKDEEIKDLNQRIDELEDLLEDCDE